MVKRRSLIQIRIRRHVLQIANIGDNVGKKIQVFTYTFVHS
jgi:hypothetical protein